MARLQGMGASAEAARLALRLELVRGQMYITESDSTRAVAAIGKLLDGLAERSRERACALSIRAMAFDYLNQPDRAVADALVAYRLAEENGWTKARVESAYTLARNFRRAGLYGQAHKMIDIVIDAARSQNLTQLASTAEYEHGQLLVSERRFREARTDRRLLRIVGALGDGDQRFDQTGVGQDEATDLSRQWKPGGSVRRQ